MYNIINIDNKKVNLCFEYNSKSQNNTNSNLMQKTNEKTIIEPPNSNNFAEINFNDSLIVFTDINKEEDFIHIFIEINRQRIFNPKNKNNIHFLLKLKDIDGKTNFSMKIENIFSISFDFVLYENSNKIDMYNNNDNESDSDENDERISINSAKNKFIKYENKEDKIKEVKRINNLFRRIKIINDLMVIKKLSFDEFLTNKDNNESIDDENNHLIKELNLTQEHIVEKEIFKKDKKNVKLSDFMKKSKKKESPENKGKISIKLNSNEELEFNDANTLKFETKRFITNQNIKEFQIKRAKRLEDKSDKESYNKLLASTNYKVYLNEINEKKKLKKEVPKRETFCSGFFITSISPKKPSIIENSEMFPSSCSHPNCSIFKSMKPEILMRYPLKDTDEIEITDFAATLCFPTGIKICYNDSNPSKMKDYSSFLTNKKGERLFIMTYHFYLKMKKENFNKEYDNYPLINKLKELDEKIKKIDFKIIDENTYKYFEELKVSKELEFKKFAYIPYCLALISKYPFTKQLKQCLECIFKIIEYQANNNALVLNEILMYLIHSIPIPNKHSIISFPLPYVVYNKENTKSTNNNIELDLPSDKNILNSNLCEILKLFRIKNIIRIIRLLLFEKKIVFIDSDYSRLTNVISSFLCLIYPFQWVHICIPIISIQMMKYLETFLPYIAGVHSSFVPNLKKFLAENSNENEQVYLIFIEEDKIRISDFLNGDSKKINKTRFIHENLVNLPVWMYITLERLLKNIQCKVKNSNESRNLEYNKEIQNAFLEIFVEMFENYKKYIYKIGDETFFNKDAFLSNKNYFEKSFFKEFLDTQMFLQFKQDILNDGFEKFKNKISERNYDYLKQKFGESLPRKTRLILSEQEKTKYKINHKFKNIIKENEQFSLKKENYIITYLNTIKDEDYNEKECMVYFLPDFQTIGSIVGKQGNIDKKVNKDKQKKNAEEDKKRKFQLYKIEEQIKEFILKIFKTETNIKDDDYKSILQILKDEEKGREYFTELISNNLNNTIILPKNSFNALSKLIEEILLIIEKQVEANEDLYKQAVLLVKSTMNYGTKTKNKKITIWEKSKEKLRENPLILQEKFWHEWYLFELNENINLDGIFLNEVKNNILVNISKIMNNLGIDKSIIALYTNNLMNNYFENDNTIEKTKTEILNHINFKI